MINSGSLFCEKPKTERTFGNLTKLFCQRERSLRFFAKGEPKTARKTRFWGFIRFVFRPFYYPFITIFPKINTTQDQKLAPITMKISAFARFCVSIKIHVFFSTLFYSAKMTKTGLFHILGFSSHQKQHQIDTFCLQRQNS